MLVLSEAEEAPCWTIWEVEQASSVPGVRTYQHQPVEEEP